MKILQVTNFFKPSWEAGGLARAAYEISKKFLENGHEVTVYTTDGFKRKIDVEKNKPVEVDGLKTYYFTNLTRYLAGIASPIPYYLPMVARKEIMNFDVIHLHGLTMIGFLVHRYAKKYDIPYLLQGHGSLFFKMRGKVSFSPNGIISIKKMNLIKKARNTLFERPTLHSASKFIALTKTEAEQCKKIDIDEEKIEIIPNGINLSEYDILPEKGMFRKKYLLGENEKLILYLGRIHRIKGLDLLVKAFAGLLKEFDNARLVIVGPDDGFLSTLKNLVQDLKIGDKVLFTGLLYERDKLEAYVDADVYVLPSMYETFPSTVLEAWACGTPVITTDRCGIADIVSKVGFVVKYDIEQIQNAIFEILSDDKLRKKFGAKGLKLVEEEFSWNTVIRKIETLYETVLTKNDRKCSTI